MLDIVSHLREAIAFEPVEQLRILMFDPDRRLIADFLHATGTAADCDVDLQKIVAAAIGVGADGMIVAHNHPAGTLKPSDDDIRVTDKLARLCQLVRLKLYDHIIVTPNGHFSFLNEDQLWNVLDPNLDRLLAMIDVLPRTAKGRMIEHMVDQLDVQDGDVDQEPNDEDEYLAAHRLS